MQVEGVDGETGPQPEPDFYEELHNGYDGESRFEDEAIR